MEGAEQKLHSDPGRGDRDTAAGRNPVPDTRTRGQTEAASQDVLLRGPEEPNRSATRARRGEVTAAPSASPAEPPVTGSSDRANTHKHVL